MKTVVISGANGFIGSQLAAYFNAKGLTVQALVHHPANIPLAGVSYHPHSLGNDIDPTVFKNANCFIHCAYARNSYELNLIGSMKLLAISKKCGVKKNIFISSLSSKEDALSIYGKQKWDCEKLFNQPNDLILRLGLVLGNGGLFGQMKQYLKKKNRIPLISGGMQAMQTIYIHDLVQAIDTCVENDIPGTLSIASPEQLTYKEFYSHLCKSLNVIPYFISIPYGLLYFILSVSETIGIKLPVSRENLLGLKKQIYVDTSSDLKKIGIELNDCLQSLSELSKQV